MLRPGSLTFWHTATEGAFRKEWDRSSVALLRLSSLITLLIWLSAWKNVNVHCGWSHVLCKVVEAICFTMCASQAWYQVVMMRHPAWTVPEPNKAWVWVADLISSMVFILLLRDLEEVPLGTHGWVFSCHGWGILFLQATSISAFHMHMLNLLCYMMVEGYVAFEFGHSSSSFHGGMRQFLLLMAGCGLAPYSINVLIEVQMRRSFLNRYRRNTAAQG